MGRNSCTVKQKLRKGLWSPEEDEKLFNYISRFGVGCWSSVPKLAGLQRCGKSCRLRWINYLRPDLKRGTFSQQEEDLIISLHQALGNRWAQIASQLPGRTDNEIKNLWNSSLKKKLMKQGIDPNTHKPITEIQVKDEKDTDPNGSAIAARMDQHLNNTGQLQGYDHPVFLSEFQQTVFGFNSMPDLTNFDQRKRAEADYSDTSNMNSHDRIQTNIENSTTFSWDVDNKLDSMFQFQFQSSGILTEDYSHDYAFHEV